MQPSGEGGVPPSDEPAPVSGARTTALLLAAIIVVLLVLVIWLDTGAGLFAAGGVPPTP